ncbi:hypothetical protein EMMF5_001090 [Cystobasidiomycetes sp. EMM_F5]
MESRRAGTFSGAPLKHDTVMGIFSKKLASTVTSSTSSSSTASITASLTDSGSLHLPRLTRSGDIATPGQCKHQNPQQDNVGATLQPPIIPSRTRKISNALSRSLGHSPSSTLTTETHSLKKSQSKASLSPSNHAMLVKSAPEGSKEWKKLERKRLKDEEKAAKRAEKDAAKVTQKGKKKGIDDGNGTIDDFLNKPAYKSTYTKLELDLSCSGNTGSQRVQASPYGPIQISSPGNSHAIPPRTKRDDFARFSVNSMLNFVDKRMEAEEESSARQAKQHVLRTNYLASGRASSNREEEREELVRDQPHPAVVGLPNPPLRPPEVSLDSMRSVSAKQLRKEISYLLSSSEHTHADDAPLGITFATTQSKGDTLTHSQVRADELHCRGMPYSMSSPSLLQLGHAQPKTPAHPWRPTIVEKAKLHARVDPTSLSSTTSAHEGKAGNTQILQNPRISSPHYGALTRAVPVQLPGSNELVQTSLESAQSPKHMRKRSLSSPAQQLLARDIAQASRAPTQMRNMETQYGDTVNKAKPTMQPSPASYVRSRVQHSSPRCTKGSEHAVPHEADLQWEQEVVELWQNLPDRVSYVPISPLIVYKDKRTQQSSKSSAPPRSLNAARSCDALRHFAPVPAGSRVAGRERSSSDASVVDPWYSPSPAYARSAANTPTPARSPVLTCHAAQSPIGPPPSSPLPDLPSDAGLPSSPDNQRNFATEQARHPSHAQPIPGEETEALFVTPPNRSQQRFVTPSVDSHSPNSVAGSRPSLSIGSCSASSFADADEEDFRVWSPPSSASHHVGQVWIAESPVESLVERAIERHGKPKVASQPIQSHTNVNASSPLRLKATSTRSDLAHESDVQRKTPAVEYGIESGG